jgi:hypothetical protein
MSIVSSVTAKDYLREQPYSLWEWFTLLHTHECVWVCKSHSWLTWKATCWHVAFKMDSPKVSELVRTSSAKTAIFVVVLQVWRRYPVLVRVHGKPTEFFLHLKSESWTRTRASGLMCVKYQRYLHSTSIRVCTL